jgi:hypothetical protein
MRNLCLLQMLQKGGWEKILQLQQLQLLVKT